LKKIDDSDSEILNFWV